MDTLHQNGSHGNQVRVAAVLNSRHRHELCHEFLSHVQLRHRIGSTSQRIQANQARFVRYGEDEHDHELRGRDAGWEHVQDGRVDVHLCVHVGDDGASFEELGEVDMMNDEKGVHLKSHESDVHRIFVTTRISLLTSSVAKKRFSTY